MTARVICVLSVTSFGVCYLGIASMQSLTLDPIADVEG